MKQIFVTKASREKVQDEPKVIKFFYSLAENEQHNYIKWVYSAKQEETKVERLAETINRLTRSAHLARLLHHCPHL